MNLNETEKKARTAHKVGRKWTAEGRALLSRLAREVHQRRIKADKQRIKAEERRAIAVREAAGEVPRRPTVQSRRVRTTLEELRLLFDWSLPGRRMYGLFPGDRFYIVAKVVVETDEPIYPCRPSESREVSMGAGFRRRQGFPSSDKSKWTYPSGRFTTWLRTNEIQHALAHGRVVECHEAFLTLVNDEHAMQVWKKLRHKIFRLYGRTCMRCGDTTGQMHVDHIKPWSKFPDLRYDPENLQVLCRACHAWKEAQGKEMDFRPHPGQA